MAEDKNFEGGIPIGSGFYPRSVGYFLMRAEDIHVGKGKSLAEYIEECGGVDPTTVWLINENPDTALLPTGYADRIQVSFTAGGVLYSGIRGNKGQIFYYNSAGTDVKLVYDVNHWNSETYRNITINEKITDGRLYGWLMLNATLMSGTVISPLQTQYDEALATNKKTVVEAINEINADYQPKTDNALATTDKTIVGAINEIVNAEQGEIILPNNASLRGTTTTGATPNLIKINGSNNISVGGTTYTTYIYGPSSKGACFPNGVTINGDSTTNFLQITGNSSNPGMRFYNGNFVTYSKSNGSIINAIYAYSNYALLSGTWKSTSSITVNSDRTKKCDIESIPNAYELVFDKLRPVIYKYNDGKSDRYHIGFIAQELEDAVISSGLTTKDFAAICYDLDAEGNKVDYTIRYEELIALNTLEIQKLKKKNDELEGRLAALETMKRT